jgi:hypothetical protein
MGRLRTRDDTMTHQTSIISAPAKQLGNALFARKNAHPIFVGLKP